MAFQPPATIKALMTKGDSKVAVETIPFGTLKENIDLDPNAVMIKTEALALNPTDWKHSIGPWVSPSSPPLVVGCDSAGTVVAIGSAVTHVKVGDKAAGFLHGTHDERNGAYSEFGRFVGGAVLRLPSGMTAVEGASFPIPHLTAVQYLYSRLNLAPPSKPSTEGKSILIWGGSTAVGHHAIQLANLSGYKVYTTASAKNHPHLLSLGATGCFDYRDPDVVQKIRAAVPGLGMAVDCVGDDGATDLVVDCMADEGGHVVSVLPVAKATEARRGEVFVEFALAYCVMGHEFHFANTGIFFPASPSDAAASLSWVTNELPALLEGWETSEGGSKRFKCQKLRVMEGGLDRVHEGLEVMRDGAYASEKLVYNLV